MPHPAEMEPDLETLPGFRPGDRRGIRWWSWLIFGAIVLGLAFAARYLWIEPSSMGLTCAALPPPQWCGWREHMILIHQADGWGLAALAGGIAAIIFRWRWTVALGLAAGLFGLVLYNAGLAAVGLLLALLRLLRP